MAKADADRPGRAGRTAAAARSSSEPVQASATKASAKKASRRSPSSLPVRQGEDSWTASDVAHVRAELEADRARLLDEVAAADLEIKSLLRDGGDGAGNDQADVGSKALERDAEMSLANNSREMLLQVEHALARLDDGSYGVCESCGQPIGKLRLMAFPRATLCLSCKQQQERR
ncbi:MAG: TraR/DksA C4-type zinc finger protein [Actinomycetota bacterium]|nr:TraR/DksA family transcriptional regulator [Nocardioidaceae bacterium]MDQ3591517.1 TraR/DksA C4-type zinc finger protein [Actinomycetota bacterium]